MRFNVTAFVGIYLTATLSLNFKQVEKDADIFISVWNLHRSPEYWERPNEFDPTRFDLAQGVPNETTHNFAYLPFGGGRRKCIGAIWICQLQIAQTTNRDTQHCR